MCDFTQFRNNGSVLIAFKFLKLACSTRKVASNKAKVALDDLGFYDRRSDNLHCFVGYQKIVFCKSSKKANNQI